MKNVKRVRAHEKNEKLFSSDRYATEIASAVERDLSKAQMFDHAFDSDTLLQLTSRQIRDTLKRYQKFDGYNRDLLEDEAVSKFELINDSMKDFNLKLLDSEYLSSHEWYRATGGTRIQDPSFTLLDVLLTARTLIKQVLGKFDMELFHRHVKHGSGSTYDIKFNDVSVDLKFRYPISCTAGAKRLFEKHTRINTTLSRAIQELNGNLAYGDLYDIVEASRGSTVDKDSTKRRIIACEPTLNMFCQQGLMAMMYACLRSSNLDVRTLPSKHRKWAQKGSLDQSIGTIDFSDASNTVCYELVRWLFPEDWFEMLDMVRTPIIRFGYNEIKLNMFSTMGNATTFPIETLIFYAIACSCTHYAKTRSSSLVSHRTKESCSVFGDDCIVPTDSCPLFMEVCEAVGFRVNREKSFTDKEDCFRESCGGDYYRGTDVRPYSFKAPHNQKLSSLEPWLYTILNNFLPKYIQCFGSQECVWFTELGNLVMKLFEEHKLSFKFVPQDFPDDSGLRTPKRLLSVHSQYIQMQSHVTIAPIYNCEESEMLEFSVVKFQYKKRKKMNEYIRYAMFLYRLTGELESEDRRVIRRVVSRKELLLNSLDFVPSHPLNPDYLIDPQNGDIELNWSEFRRTPVRKKGGYVLSKAKHHF